MLPGRGTWQCWGWLEMAVQNEEWWWTMIEVQPYKTMWPQTDCLMNDQRERLSEGFWWISSLYILQRGFSFFRGWWHSARLILLWHQTQVWSAIFNSYTTCIWGCTNRGVGLVLVHMNLREHGKIAGMPWRTPVFCGRWWCFEGNTSPGPGGLELSSSKTLGATPVVKSARSCMSRGKH